MSLVDCLSFYILYFEHGFPGMLMRHPYTVIPTGPGLLPYWQLFIGVVAGLNTVQNIRIPATARRVYSAAPVADSM